MKPRRTAFLLSIIAAASAAATASTDLPEWQDPNAFRLNQLDPHALVVPYANSPSALAAIADFRYASSPWYLDLNGSWKFRWSQSPDSRPQGFEAPAYKTEGWGDINVPGNWQTQGHGVKLYVNTTYEFDSDYYNFKKCPPLVPNDSNEVGCYRRTFTVPASWQGRRTVLCLEGVSSFYYVWVNGHLLGYNQDSKTAAEWDITDCLVPGENVLALEVYRWSAGSYLECQDMWRLSGIERDVYLYSTPRTYVADYTVTTPLDSAYTDGLFGLHASIGGPVEDGASLDYALYSPHGDKVASGSASLADTVAFSATVPGVMPWTAETPSLYTLELLLRSPGGKVSETLGCNVGFRTSEVRGGQYLLNGKPILIKGVNRHSFTQAGHYVDEATMLRDIQLMKLNNINTVRNSHYPADRRWYHLADRHGLYLIDEANIESHGMGYREQSLANFPLWLGAHLDRTRRMYAKSKNNPSVTFYSLGNEAGNGVNFHDTYRWLKSVEHNRPVQYERALEDFNTDIVAYMYASIDYVRRYCRKPGIYRPFILCEYAHAMGNSVGSLSDYWDMFESEPLAQGGCIWDWVDQSFIEHTPGGKIYYTYGGDYGGEGIPSDLSFCCNGLVNSDRTPHPHLDEVRAVYRNIKSSLAAPASSVDSTAKVIPLAVNVRNWHFFTPLSDFDMRWSLVTPDGKVLARGTRRVDCDPQQSVTVALGDITLPAALRSLPDLYLNIDWLTRRSTAMIPAGHAVAAEQLTVRRAPLPDPGALASVPLRHDRASGRVTAAEGGATSFTVDPVSGAVTSLMLRGREVLASPLALSLFRPYTENDASGVGQGKLWTAQGLDSVYTMASAPRLAGNALKVAAGVFGRDGQVLGNADFTYALTPGGQLAVTCTFDPDTAVVRSLPRVGLAFRTPAALASSVVYDGRSGETYSDRCTAGRLGVHTTTPAADFHPYIVPQATGNHTSVRSLTLNGKPVSSKGVTSSPRTLTVTADRLFQCSATPYADLDIHRGRHLNDLTDDGLVTVHVDALQTGVGTATCGPDILWHYNVPIRPVTFTFLFD